MTTTPDGSAGEALGVVILGASRFPHYPADKHFDNEAFGRSATAFRRLFEPGGVSLRSPAAILDLFESPKDIRDLAYEVQRFIRDHRRLTDIVIYYCGHGIFLSGDDNTYALMIPATEPGLENVTAFRVRDLHASLELHLAMKRVYLVFDACYSGQVAAAWQGGTVGPVIARQAFSGFARRGTTLLAASSADEPALAPSSLPLTMFTEALVHNLEGGIPEAGQYLSFRDVYRAATSRIEDWPGRKALPEIHAPYKPDGDIGDDPFFLNRAYRPPEILPTPEERDRFEDAIDDLSRSRPERRVAAVEALAALAAGTAAPPLRADILARLEAVRGTDDSLSVRNAATAALAELAPPEAEAEPEPDDATEEPDVAAADMAEEAEPPPPLPEPKPPVKPSVTTNVTTTASSGSIGKTIANLAGLLAVIVFFFGAAQLLDHWPDIQTAAGGAWTQIGHTVFGTPPSPPEPDPQSIFPVPATIDSDVLKTFETATEATHIRSTGTEAELTIGPGLTSLGSVAWSRYASPFSTLDQWTSVDGKVDIPDRNISGTASISSIGLMQGHAFEITLSLSQATTGLVGAAMPALSAVTGIRLGDTETGPSTSLSGGPGTSTDASWYATDEASYAADRALLENQPWMTVGLAFAGGKTGTLLLHRNDDALRTTRDVFALWDAANDANSSAFVDRLLKSMPASGGQSTPLAPATPPSTTP